jgi:ABC-type molybdate transport system ATPase subunit
MNIISGVFQPDVGIVEIDGVKVNDLKNTSGPPDMLPLR